MNTTNITNTAVALAREADLRLLMARFPLASRWQFRAYHPAIWPRDWRRAAEQAPWGMRSGDVLEVTGYGSAADFPEALLMDRVGDGTAVMLFPPEVAPLARLGVIPIVDDGAAARRAAGDHKMAREEAQRLRAAQTWADDGGAPEPEPGT
jgi:hypothetical protein